MTESDVRTELATAYEAVAKAEVAGGNVTALVSQLDDIARKLPGASPDSLATYKSTLDDVLAKAPVAETQGSLRITSRLIVVAGVLIVIAALGVAVYTRGSRWFWGLWLRTHSGWRVARADESI
ncbi:MAG: hypothetical protein ABSA11_03430 [Candidatus Bathyarchaeia archaeon]